MSEDLKKNRSDAFKMLFEFFKHLTTLSSGAILIVLALAEKFIKQPAEVHKLFGSMALFGVSVATALIAMGVLAFHADGTKLSEGATKLLASGTVMTGAAFFGGMAWISVVVIRTLS